MRSRLNGLQEQREHLCARLVEPTVVGVVTALVAAYWATSSILIHRAFHSNGWDLGLLHQVLWNSARGRLFDYSFRDISYAGDHWQPFLLTLAPLEWLQGGPEGLLIVQAIFLAAAAIPLYAGARAVEVGRGGAAALAGAYLLGLGAARSVSFDFHIEAFAPLFAFTALWGLARGRRVVFVAAVLVILTLKEDGALLTLALSWIGWFGFKERLSAATAGVATIYMFLATSVIIPYFRGADLNPFAERYGYLGDSPAGVLGGMATRPDLVLSQLARPEAALAIAIVLASVVLLPLLVPRLLPPLAMVTLLPLLSKGPAQGSLELHYLLVPATVAMAVAIIAAGDLARRGPSALAGPLSAAIQRIWPFLLLGVPALLWMLGSPLPPSFAADLDRFDVDHHASVAQKFIREIPAGAIVSAQSPFVPHLSERRKLYQFPRVLDAEFVLLDGAGAVPADDLAAGYAACLAALPRLGFEETDREDEISLWRKVRPAESVPEVPVACSGQRPGGP